MCAVSVSPGGELNYSMWFVGHVCPWMKCNLAARRKNISFSVSADAVIHSAHCVSVSIARDFPQNPSCSDWTIILGALLDLAIKHLNVVFPEGQRDPSFSVCTVQFLMIILDWRTSHFLSVTWLTEAVRWFTPSPLSLSSLPVTLLLSLPYSLSHSSDQMANPGVQIFAMWYICSQCRELWHHWYLAYRNAVHTHKLSRMKGFFLSSGLVLMGSTLL